jgi:hypothetical protein
MCDASVLKAKSCLLDVFIQLNTNKASSRCRFLKNFEVVMNAPWCVRFQHDFSALDTEHYATVDYFGDINEIAVRCCWVLGKGCLGVIDKIGAQTPFDENYTRPHQHRQKSERRIQNTRKNVS